MLAFFLTILIFTFFAYIKIQSIGNETKLDFRVILLVTISIVNASPFHIHKRAVPLVPCDPPSPIVLTGSIDPDPEAGKEAIAKTSFVTTDEVPKLFLTTTVTDGGDAKTAEVTTADLCAGGLKCPVPKGQFVEVISTTDIPDGIKAPVVEYNFNDGAKVVSCGVGKAAGGAPEAAPAPAPKEAPAPAPVPKETPAKEPEPKAAPPAPPVPSVPPAPSAPPATPATSGATSISVTESDKPANNTLTTSIIGVLIGGLVLISLVALGFFLLKIYKNKKERSKAIATPGRTIIVSNNEETNNELVSYENKSLPVPKGVVISNHQGQEFIPNQQGTTQNIENSSDIIQHIKQELMNDIRQEMAEMSHQNSSNNVKSSTNIDKEIMDQVKQEILQEIKQELKQNKKN